MVNIYIEMKGKDYVIGSREEVRNVPLRKLYIYRPLTRSANKSRPQDLSARAFPIIYKLFIVAHLNMQCMGRHRISRKI